MAAVENSDFSFIKIAIKEDLAKVDTIGKVFLSKLFSYPDKTFLKYKKYGSFRNISYAETFNSMKSFYIQLSNLGLVKGDKVLFISENRQQLITSVFGAAMSGFVSVLADPGYTRAQIKEIIDNCRPKCIVISDDTQLDKLDNVKDTHIISFDKLSNEILYYKDIIKKYRDSDIDYEKVIYDVSFNNLAYILYKFDEIGRLEGVKLYHNNVLASVRQVYDETDTINDTDTVLSHLPLSFIGGLFYTHLILYSGAVCAVASSTEINTLLENIKEADVSIFSSTPGVWKKLFEKLTLKTTVEKNLQKGFCWGIFQDSSFVEFFKKIDIDITQFYGITETSGPYAYMKSDKEKLKPFNGIKVNVGKDSEILVKSNEIIAGYVDNHSPLLDGWFKTGDIGTVDEYSNIKIHGKNTDSITLLSGYKVSPKKIEDLIKNKFIAQIVVVGEKKEFLSALIVPEFECLKEYAHKELKIQYKTIDELIKNRWIKALYRLILENLNDELASFEKIKGFTLLTEPFSVDSIELTPEGKLVRDIITIKRSYEIESIYKAPFSRLLFETSLSK